MTSLQTMGGLFGEALNLKNDILLHTYHTDRKSTRLNSSHSQMSYAVFCLKKKTLCPPYTRVRTDRELALLTDPHVAVLLRGPVRLLTHLQRAHALMACTYSAGALPTTGRTAARPRNTRDPYSSRPWFFGLRLGPSVVPQIAWTALAPRC